MTLALITFAISFVSFLLGYQAASIMLRQEIMDEFNKALEAYVDRKD